MESSNKYYIAVSPFLYPVEKIIEEVPDYATVIKRPIDFNIIKNKLNENSYEDVNQVDEDMRLMVANAQKFNPPGHEVHTSATQLLQIWDEKWRTVPAKVETRDSSEDPMAEAFDDYSSDEDSKLVQVDYIVCRADHTHRCTTEITGEPSHCVEPTDLCSPFQDDKAPCCSRLQIQIKTQDCPSQIFHLQTFAQRQRQWSTEEAQEGFQGGQSDVQRR